MSKGKRLSILTEAEIEELYLPPVKGKYLFSETGETPDIEYLMASMEYEPLSEK